MLNFTYFKKGLFVFLTLFYGVIEVVAQDFSYTTPLIAGRTNLIGEVQVEKIGDSLDVTFVVNDSNWSMTKTFLHIASSKSGFPVNSVGTPNIQNYDHQTNHNNVHIYKYDNIDVSSLSAVYVSANANVTEISACSVDTALINSIIPSGRAYLFVTETVDPAYFQMFVADTDGNPIFYGNYFGNCVDLENPIQEGVRYYPYMVSSYSANAALLNCLVDKPENLDVVNYIINKTYNDTAISGAEIQIAIWTIIDDDVPTLGINGLTWNQSKVDDIIADAMARGQGFIPPCNGYFAVLLDQGCKDALANNTTPRITVQQSIFWLPVNRVPQSENYSYGECANAWGIGNKFSNTGWGQYFEAR